MDFDHTPLKRICAYYLDCLAHEYGNGTSVPLNDRGSASFVELGRSIAELESTHTLSTPEASDFVRAVRSSRSSSVPMIGYPVVLDPSGRGSLQPVVLWPIDSDEGGRLTLSDPSQATLNPRALHTLTGEEGADLLGVSIDLHRSLGLADEDSTQVLDPEDMVEGLRRATEDWPWAVDENNVEHELPALGGALQSVCVLRRSVLIGVESSPFTRGLEFELRSLQESNQKDGQQSSLGSIMVPGSGSSQGTSSQGFLDVVTLNDEQERAVRSALTAPLTVITGPPGTGKSQVVTSIVINAARNGQKVLVSSKNNKAVDVVEDRVNSLSKRPVLLRLGGQQGQPGVLADYLGNLLSYAPSDTDRRQLEDSSGELQVARDRIHVVEDRIKSLMDLRNRVDELDRSCDAVRSAVGEPTFQAMRRVNLDDLRKALVEMEARVGRSNPDEQGALTRLFWSLLKKSRYGALDLYVSEYRTVMESIGVVLPAAGDWSLGQWTRAVEDLRARVKDAELVAEYTAQLEELREQTPLEAQYAELFEGRGTVRSKSLLAWDAWLRTLPDRLTGEARRLIGKFASTLTLLNDLLAEGARPEGQLWREYYSLSEKVAEYLPAWAVTSLSAKGRLPLAQGAFDLLVIDEASQCDPASAIPLLYRAKRAVVIGDPNQLHHICSFPAATDQALLRKHDLLTEDPRWSYRSNSLFDLASQAVQPGAIVNLLDHYRSHEDIIEFSNQRFYDSRLRIATKYNELKGAGQSGPAVVWRDVRGTVERPGGRGARNRAEVSAVVTLVGELLGNDTNSFSMGIVTPFRAQANALQKAIFEDPAISNASASVDVLVDTVHKFQGDERDVMVFSPVVSDRTPATAAGFLEANSHLFNVAITRARSRLFVVGDMNAIRNGAGGSTLGAFAQYVVSLQRDRPDVEVIQEAVGDVYPTVANPEDVSVWEKTLFRLLRNAGVPVLPQHTIEKFVVDLAVITDHSRLVIEVDGEAYHRSWTGEILYRDMLRNERLRELGWDVMRIWVYEIRDEADAVIDRIRCWYDEWK